MESHCALPSLLTDRTLGAAFMSHECIFSRKRRESVGLWQEQGRAQRCQIAAAARKQLNQAETAVLSIKVGLGRPSL